MAPKGKSKSKTKPNHRKTTASASTSSVAAARIIPFDVTFDILSRLPVKTLLRFKCVSKQWRTLVSLPRFVSAHLTRSPASLIIHTLRGPIPAAAADEPWARIEDLIKATFADVKAQPQPDPDDEAQPIQPDGHIISLYGPPGPKSTVAQVPDFPGSDMAGFDYLEVIGSPNGVVCIYQHVYATKLTLWNPATRFSRPVPPPGIRPDPALHRIANVGLAFDPSCNDYKVIRITCAQLHLSKPDVAEVFSVKSGRWEPVGLPGDLPLVLSGNKCVAVVGGVPYWTGVTYDPSSGIRPIVMSYDVRRAAFDVEPLGWVTSKMDMCMGEIREGCLGAVAWDGDSENEVMFDVMFDVWMRVGEGVWNKIYQAGLSPEVKKVVGFYGDRLGIVVEDGGEGNLSMLSLEEEKMKIEDLLNVEGSVPGRFSVVNYRESLCRIPEIGNAVIRTRFDAGGKTSRDRAKKRIGRK